MEPLSPDGGLEAPAVDGAELLDDGLLELWLLDEGLLELWLLDDWELEDWLLEVELLCEELLELELELEELGGCGIVGVVGLLALGQPVSATQAPTARPSCISRMGVASLLPLCRVIGPNAYLCLHWLQTFESRSEAGLAQLPHQAVGLRLVFQIVVEPGQVNDPAPRRYHEF